MYACGAIIETERRMMSKYWHTERGENMIFRAMLRPPKFAVMYSLSLPCRRIQTGFKKNAWTKCFSFVIWSNLI
jgi:hypothetical protein